MRPMSRTLEKERLYKDKISAPIITPKSLENIPSFREDFYQLTAGESFQLLVMIEVSLRFENLNLHSHPKENPRLC